MKGLQRADYNVVFISPEVLRDVDEWRELLTSITIYIQ